MSDSLLNLLEVLNEVLEEQGLQEQESGGAPTLEDIYRSVDVSSPEEAITKILELSSGWGPWATGPGSKEKNRIRKKQKEGVNNFFNKSSEYILAKNLSLLQEQQSDRPSTITPAPASPAETNFYNALLQICQKSKSLPIRGKSNALSVLASSLKTEIVVPNRRDGRLKHEQSEAYLEILFKNLIKGIGTYSILIAIGGATRGVQAKPHVISDQLTTLDYLDLRSIEEKIDELSDENSYVDNQKFHEKLGRYVNMRTNILKSNISEKYIPMYINLAKATFNEIFRKAYQDSEKRNKWKSTLAHFFDVTGVRQQRPTLTNTEYFKEFATDWAEKFASRDRTFFKGQYNYQPRGNKPFADSKTNYDKKIADLETDLDSFTSPGIKISGGSLSNDFLFVVNNFFDPSANDFNSRLNQFDEKMSIFFKDSDELKNELLTMGTLEFMNRVLLMDYFVEFSKGFNSQIAGTLFEYFLAGLFNGKVVGERGDVVDFEVGSDLYSAKFLSPTSGKKRNKNVKQSLSSFQKKPNSNITYIVARKRKSRKASSQAGFVPVREIHDVELYKFDIKYVATEQEIESGKIGKFIVNGGEQIKSDDAVGEQLVTIADKKVVMDSIVNKLTPFTTIRIMSTDNDTIKAYREALKEKLETSTAKLVQRKKNILNMVQAIFDNLKEGESSARKYVSSGDKQQGVEATKKLDVSKKGIIALSDAAAEYDKLPEPNDT